MSPVLVTIQYEVEPAKREACITHLREMRDHAVRELQLEYQVYQDSEHPGQFIEVFSCPDLTAADNLDERQDEAFRGLVATLDRYTDLAEARFSVFKSI
ncbi:MAG: hypothetical protein AAF533_14690 [Acidobacteriota bacterium]